MLLPPIHETSDCGVSAYWPPAPSVAYRVNRVSADAVTIPATGKMGVVGLPVLLSACGPYQIVDDLWSSEKPICHVYSTSAGEILLLRVVDPDHVVEDEGSIRIDSDSRRIYYHGASWVQDGRIWSIEGRRSLAMELQELVTLS